MRCMYCKWLRISTRWHFGSACFSFYHKIYSINQYYRASFIHTNMLLPGKSTSRSLLTATDSDEKQLNSGQEAFLASNALAKKHFHLMSRHSQTYPSFNTGTYVHSTVQASTKAPKSGNGIARPATWFNYAPPILRVWKANVKRQNVLVLYSKLHSYKNQQQVGDFLNDCRWLWGAMLARNDGRVRPLP